jgi:hypothetical protein
MARWLSLIVAMWPASMTAFIKVECSRKLEHGIGIKACKRDSHGLQREMGRVVNVLVPRKSKAFV